MTRSIDFTVIDNLRASASRGRHAHVIQETFAISDELQNLQLHLLDLRARSYVACAQFDSALDTASTMQQLNPASALGYLCQGYIHMEQGRYIAACHVYDKALEHVDQHDPLYGTIQTAEAEAMQQSKKRRDFICDLPLEIIGRIIHEIMKHEEFIQQRKYVVVSSAWWHRIMATNQLEYNMKAPLPYETSNMVIQSFNYTRSLTLKLWKHPLGHLFQDYRFIRLTTLSLSATTPTHLGENISALGAIGTQLTKLMLTCEGQRMYPRKTAPTVRLEHILTTCPNLESLLCEAATDIPSLNETYPRLRALKLYDVRGTVDRQHMMMIREHLPSLQTLNMAIRFSLKPLLVDDTWLPCIRHLAYGDRIKTTTKKFEDAKRYGQQGLASFSITGTSDQFQLDDILPLVIHHHTTLQFLEFKTLLNTTDTRKMMKAMEKDQHIEFKQLETLEAYSLFISSAMGTLQTFCNFINWIIECSPYLRTVALKGYTMTQSSLSALAKCMYLRHVDFEIHNTRRPDNYDTRVAEFLRDHVDYMADKGGSRLESIRVQLYAAHPTLIHAIRELKCLTSFHLITNVLGSERFTQLFTSLRQGCQKLTTLYIKADEVDEAIPNPILYQIGGLSNLRTLTMIGDLHHSQAGVLSLQRCRHLQQIILDRPIDGEIRSMLLQNNPGLDISYP